MRHGILEERTQLLPLALELLVKAGGEHEDTGLRYGAFDKCVEMLGTEAEVAKPCGLVAEVG